METKSGPDLPAASASPGDVPALALFPDPGSGLEGGAGSALLAAAGALAESLDRETVLRGLARLALGALGDCCVAVAVGEEEIEAAAAEGAEAGMRPLLDEVARRWVRDGVPGGHPLARALRSGAPERVDALTAGGGDREALRAVGAGSLLCVPMVARGRTVGAALFASRAAEGYGAGEVALAVALAARAAPALENARRYAEATAAAARAGASSALLDALFRAAPLGLAFLDPELRFVAVNDALARVNGLSAPEHQGKTLREVSSGCADAVEAAMRRVLESGEPVELEWSGAVPERPGELRHWVEGLYPVRAGGALLGVGVTLAEITAHKRAEDTQRFLSDASRLVAPIGDGEAWLERLPRAALPRLGDYCVLDLAGDDGRPARTEVAHVDPARERMARAFRERFPLEARGTGFPVARVLRTGRPEVVYDAASRPVEEEAGDAARGAIAEALRPTSYMVLPITAHGRTLGAMSFVMSEPGRRHTPDDVALAHELVARVALALENARLYEAERAAAARMARLFSLTAALSGAVTADEVARVIVTHAMRDLGALQGIVSVVDDGGGALRVVGAEGVASGLLPVGRVIPLAEPTPLTDPARLGTPVVAGSAEALDARYPRLARRRAAEGVAACAAVPLEVDGRVTGSLGFTFAAPRDFSSADLDFLHAIARQCAQALERARLYEAERRARADAEDANRAKGDFLATMSHELRTPLNAISGYVQLMEMGIQGEVNDAQRESLRRIQRNQRHLLGLINDVLNFARMERGHLSLCMAAVPVGPALAEMEALVAPQMDARALAYRCHAAHPALVARADAEKLQQVLLNLLSNAAKFTEPGGRVEVDAARVDGHVEIRVRDTGVGIPDDKRAEVFEPFVQLDRGLTRTTEGTGLGLAISRDLARAMGGDLSVASNPGGGSVFTLTLESA